MWFSLTQANTDSDVMTTFLRHLARQLDREDQGWEVDSLILLEGAVEFRGYLMTKIDLDFHFGGRLTLWPGLVLSETYLFIHAGLGDTEGLEAPNFQFGLGAELELRGHPLHQLLEQGRFIGFRALRLSSLT